MCRNFTEIGHFLQFSVRIDVASTFFLIFESLGPNKLYTNIH